RKAVGRPLTDERIDEVIRSFRELGVDRVHASFLVGLPPETPADVAMTQARARALAADGVFSDIFPVVAFPGSAYFRDPARFGIELRMRRPADFHRLSRDWFAPLSEEMLSYRAPALSGREVIEAIFRTRIEQRVDAGHRIPPELFLFMQHGNLPISSQTAEKLYRHGERYLDGWSAAAHHASLPTARGSAPHPPADVYGEE
ncbi:MAG: hypothetical protein ACE5GW_09690, partial [Planctomycetota bacterium]